MNIYGDIDGVRKNILKDLEAIYEIQVPIGQIFTNELVSVLLELTLQIKREIAVYINRHGKIVQVTVGDIQTVKLPEIEGRKSTQKLSGIRCVHTHPNGDSTLSAPDISALRRMRFDMMIAVAAGSEGEIKEAIISIAFLTGEYDKNDNLLVEEFGPTILPEITKINLSYLITLIDKQLGNSSTMVTLVEKERAILAGLEYSNNKNAWNIEDSLSELKQLAETAGAEVIDRVMQKRGCPDSALFLGKGKIQELSLLIQEHNANLLIFDDELTPSQQRNIEQLLGIKVLDRTSLILDIFAQRAHSHEGKLQVELAQLRYHLPRIGGQGLILSRLGGGIGTRGPGETKLEVDKRRIRSRINDIEKQIEAIKKHRNLHRENRIASKISTVALVGYTNAGKSTLLNALTSAGVLAEDKLFATLDPTTRKVILSNDQEVLITDTVGFIQKLPHQLVSAFRATLEEVKTADLLLHVVDISHINCKQQMEVVISVLKELKSDDKPTINLFNKIDKIEQGNELETFLQLPESLGISAKQSIGLDLLFKMIEDFIALKNIEVELLIPYEDSGVVSNIHDVANIKFTEYRDNGTFIKASIPAEEINKYTKFIVGE